MSEFTSGPWVADKTSRAIGPVSKEDDQSYGMVLPVAWVEFDPEVEIQAANQQLIAAAPELLEALHGVMSMFPVIEDDASGRFGFTAEARDKLNAARAAIAKALGQ